MKIESSKIEKRTAIEKYKGDTIIVDASPDAQYVVSVNMADSDGEKVTLNIIGLPTKENAELMIKEFKEFTETYSDADDDLNCLFSNFTDYFSCVINESDK